MAETTTYPTTTEDIPIIEPEEPSQQELLEKIQNNSVQVIDVSQVVPDQAADYADEYIREQTTQQGFKGFLKRIWTGNIARDYVRQKKVREGRELIIENQNVHTLNGGTKDEHDRSLGAVITRFEDDLVHSGEVKYDMNTVEGADELSQRLRHVISSFVKGDIDPDTLREEKTRIINEFGANRRTADRNKGLIYADNVIDVAINAKNAFEHGVGIDAIEAAMQIQGGEARLGVRTRANKELVDKVVDKLYATKVGSLVNETTLASVTAIAIAVSKFSVRKAISAAAITVGMGVGAGAVAGVREAHHVKQERAAHSRQMAEGGEIDAAKDKRRARIEETRYETVSAESLSEKLKSAEESYNVEQNLGSLTRFIRDVTEAQTLIKMSDELNVDLIIFSSKSDVETERLGLDVALAKAKVRLQGLLDGSDDATLLNLGVARGSINDIIETRSQVTRNIVTADFSSKDEAFNKLRRSRVASAAAIGFVTGVVIGVGSQEVHSLLDSSIQGILDHHSGADRRTELSALFGEHVTNVIHNHTGLGTEHSINALKVGNGTLDLPPGFELFHEGNSGAGQLIDSHDHKTIATLHFNHDGHLTTESEHILQEKGFGVKSETANVHTSHVESSTVQLTPAQYVANHPHEFNSVHRELWYDNNSPTPILNELRGYWGGTNGSGLDAHNNVIFNVSHMTPNGSFEGNTSANAPDLIAHGQLKIAISLNQATQNKVMFVSIDKEGNAIFDRNNPIFKSVFKVENGQVHFTGGYLEVVQINGTGPDGSTLMSPLATLPGENHPSLSHLTETVHHAVAGTKEKVITHLEAPVSKEEIINTPVEVAPVIPIYARRGLENLKFKEVASRYGYYGEFSSEQLQQYQRERSPRLARDPDVILDPGEELAWYREELAKYDTEYLRSIEETISSTPELAGMSRDTKAMVCIPVAAVNEADNIFNALSLYAQQDEGSVNETVVVLNVNWIDDARENAANSAKIDKTLTEIERAREAFPNLHIATFQSIIPRTLVNERGGVIGEVARRLFDTALVSINKANADGRHDRAEDVLIIRNDADEQGMSRSYLKNMITTFREKPETDAFVGTVRWQTALHGQYPGFGVVSNFREVMHAITGMRAVRGHTPTIGINTAVRASTFAAVGCIGHGQYIGAGSDDLEIGGRIYAARGESSPTSSSYSYGAINGSTRDGNKSARTRMVSILSRLAQRRYDGSQDLDIKPRTLNVPIAVVRGAGIDTSADRMLAPYLLDRPITRSWDDFDLNGYKDPTTSSTTSSVGDIENPQDIDEISSRIELNISAMATDWFKDPAQVRMGLAFTFPEKNKEGQPIYQLSWHNGICSFKLTQNGKIWLQNRLQRDSRGKFDPFGTRVRRSLYHEVAPGNVKLPVSPEPRFVQAAT